MWITRKFASLNIHQYGLYSASSILGDRFHRNEHFRVSLVILDFIFSKNLVSCSELMCHIFLNNENRVLNCSRNIKVLNCKQMWPHRLHLFAISRNIKVSRVSNTETATKIWNFDENIDILTLLLRRCWLIAVVAMYLIILFMYSCVCDRSNWFEICWKRGHKWRKTKKRNKYPSSSQWTSPVIRLGCIHTSRVPKWVKEKKKKKKGKERNSTKYKWKRTREGKISFFEDIQLWGYRNLMWSKHLQTNLFQKIKKELPFMCNRKRNNIEHWSIPKSHNSIQ